MKKKIFEIRKCRNVKWNSQDDNLLVSTVVKLQFKKIDWKKISELFEKKTKHQCYKRFLTINPDLKKGRWTKEEDLMFFKLMEEYGNNWNSISKIMKNRSTRQVRNRYNENLNPVLVRNKFKNEEDLLILKLYNLFSNKWSKYLNYLPNRSIKNIKRRFLRLKKLAFNPKEKSKDDKSLL